MSGIVIRELTPTALDDFLAFFDHEAFTDNPDWADCYCMFYQFTGTGKEWAESKAAQNRHQVSSLTSNGKMRGFLAYENGKMVAWCNAAPRSNYPALTRVLKLPANDSDQVGSIVCFVVAPTHRRKRIASRLLEAACKSFAHTGLEFAEAYPRRDSSSSADNFPGPLSMYLKAGFSPIRETESYVVVRKKLTK